MNQQVDHCELPTTNYELALQRNANPIGVFDSGVGGLTVLAALRRLLPHENFIYLGDTARVPYGGKSKETIMQYSQEIADFLLTKKIKLLVVACNTASALAMPSLKKLYSIPVQGVIEPGAGAALMATKNRMIGIIGTKATITSNAYRQAIHDLQPTVNVFSKACPLLVPLIEEEGLFEHHITHALLSHYLHPMLAQQIDTLVLGCTHYPLLKKMITEIVGPQVTLVDSAENCALAVQSLLASNHLTTKSTHQGTLQVLLTDTAEGLLLSVAKKLDLPISKVTTIRLC
ncbi:MAG: glutamate racemase [Chthoniobacterales bacterium]|nr:glutamate racemase [Chthoniobacterales bacterium]